MAHDALEWPPPGLGALHGRFRALTRWAATASCFILAASMGFAAYVPDEFWFRDASAAQLFVIWGGIGVVIMLGAVVGAWKDIGRATLAVRRGYTWLTVAETMADHRGDTGALISGTHDYSPVTPQVRGAMRVARVVSSTSLLLAATMPVPAIVLASWLGIQVADSRALILVVTLAPSIALVALSFIVTRVERFALRESRLGHEDALAARDAQKTVVEPWYATFDAARNERSLGRGRRGGAVLARVVNSVVCIAFALVIASLMPLWMVSLTAPAVFSWQSMRIYSIGTSRMRNYAALRQYVPPVDASISPAQAADAIHTLAMRGVGAQPAMVRRPTRSLPPFPPVPDSLFPGVRSNSLFYVYANAFPRGQTGFNTTQRDYLTKISAAPGYDLIHLAARSAHADFATARYVTPFNDTVSPFDIPSDPSAYTLDTLAWASLGRAGLLVANGKTSEAESEIADLIAMGFRLADDGVSMSDESEGAYLVQVGRDALSRMYGANPVTAGKKSWVDSVTRPPTQPAPGTQAAQSAAAQRASFAWTTSPTRIKLIAALTDSVLPRSRRFGLSRPAALLVCTNVRELLFGPAPDLRKALKTARTELVRSPAEGALFDLNTKSAERPYHAKPGVEGFSLDQVLLLKAAHAAAFVLRNNRIGNCAELAVGARQIPN